MFFNIEISDYQARITAEALMEYIENAINNGAKPDDREMQAAGHVLNMLMDRT